jgi:hypothetical protein
MSARGVAMRAFSLLLLTSACLEPIDPVAVSPRLSPGVYELSSVNGSPLPFIVPWNGATWRSGRWTVNADGSFTATFGVSAGTIPRTVEQRGVVETIDALSARVVFSDGTESIAMLTSGGFRVPIGILTLGLTR